MTGNTEVKKLTSIAAVSAEKLRGKWFPVWKFLTSTSAEDLLLSQKHLSVSIEKGNLSVAYGRKSLSKIVIKGTKEFHFDNDVYPQPKEIASTLALSVKELGATGADITLSIPKAWTIIRTSEFPSTIKENITDVISYELDRITPFTPNEAFFDFKVLNDSDNSLLLLIMAAKADLIKPYIEALNEIGLNVSKITTNISSIGTLCQYMNKMADTIFIEISAGRYEGALFVNSSISHVFSDDLVTEDEASITGIITKEISSLLEAVNGQGVSPHIMLLLENKSLSLKEAIKSSVNMPVTLLGENDITTMSKSLSVESPESLKKIPYAAIGSLIHSIWKKADNLNLLNKGRHVEDKNPVALTVALVTALIIMFFVYLIAPIKIEAKRLEQTSRQIELKKEEFQKVDVLKKEVETLSSDIATIINFKSKSPMTLNLLKELTSILPKTAWLTKARITPAAVEIGGYADSATELLPKLEASEYFRKVEFASPTFRDSNMKKDRFSIKMLAEAKIMDESEKIKDAKE